MSVAADHPALPGHFPGRPIIPGVVLLQIVLAFAGWAAPVVGALHGINAFALAGVASVAARKARTAETASVEPAAPVGSA